MKLDSPFDPNRKVSALVPILASVLIIGIDLLTPPQLLLSIFFILPVLVAAWYNGLRWALILSVVLPFTRLLIASFMEPLWEIGYNVTNALDRFVVLAIISVVGAKLSDSIKRVRVLEGVIPICAWCKKIRDHNQEWQSLERYIIDRSDTDFTHGICPDCAERLKADRIKTT